MDIASWESAVEAALNKCNLEYHPQYSAVALLSPRPPEPKDLAVDIKIAMERKFWRRVCAHQVFGEPTRVEREYGRSLEANYGVRDGPFLDVARAYWTFKVELSDISSVIADTWLYQSLIAVEWDIAKLFFPTPGPVKIPKRLRKQAQREYLQSIAPTFETDRFLKENPMLRGWFG